MKHVKRFIGSLLALCIFVSASIPASAVFPDVDGYEEFAEAVAYVNKADIMVGDENGNFNPYKTVTRAEMSVIVCKMLRETDNLTTSKKFTDVPVDHWSNQFVTRASELGFISGYGDGKFGPSDNVTYEQCATMIVRALGIDEYAQKAGGYPDGFLYAAEEQGLLEGISAEKGEPLSRADIATIVFNCQYFVSPNADIHNYS